ncbi:MAG: hypothetical protein ACMXX7_00710 [Candidatus Woesearchaeota archaeon]
MKMLKIMALVMMSMMLVMPIAIANDDFLSVETVRINGDRAEDGDDLYVERGDELRIRVTVEAGNEDVKNAQIQAFIAGYRYAHYERDLVTDFTRTFDLPAGNKRSFDLNVQIPVDMRQKDAKLRIVVSDENSPNLIVYNYQLSIFGTAAESAVQITDFLISPSTTVEAGRALSFRVRAKNVGNDVLDDITARVSIPALNLNAYETIDHLRVDQTQSFESLVIRLPNNVPAGEYEVVTTITFDRFESVQQSRMITVLADDKPTEVEDRTTVTVPPSVNLEKGSGDVLYPVLIENKGASARTYVLSAEQTNGLRANFDPSSIVVVQAGRAETVFLRLSAPENIESGDRVIQLVIESGEDRQTVNTKVTVEESQTQTTDLRTILEWSLIVLIVLLIILGLVLVFTKMKGKKEEDSEEDETQTYY